MYLSNALTIEKRVGSDARRCFDALSTDFECRDRELYFPYHKGSHTIGILAMPCVSMHCPQSLRAQGSFFRCWGASFDFGFLRDGPISYVPPPHLDLPILPSIYCSSHVQRYRHRCMPYYVAFVNPVKLLCVSQTCKSENTNAQWSDSLPTLVTLISPSLVFFEIQPWTLRVTKDVAYHQAFEKAFSMKDAGSSV